MSKSQTSQSLVVAGIMSGTSADGMDLALVKISQKERAGGVRIKLLAHRAFPWPKSLRLAILAAMAGQSDQQTTSTPELARLNWRLGIAYAEALSSLIDSTKIRPALIGCHGQTVYHQGTPGPYAGRRFACTWQLGEPALIAAALRIPVISNFRPADIAAGGQGAPLVPFLDYALFSHPTRNRALQNIGGIGNLTVIPAGALQEKVIAFDTGPGNMRSPSSSTRNPTTAMAVSPPRAKSSRPSSLPPLKKNTSANPRPNLPDASSLVLLTRRDSSPLVANSVRSRKTPSLPPPL